MKTVISTLLIGLLLATAALLGLVYSGSISVAAVDEESGFTQWLLHTTYEQSVSSHATGIEPPADLDSPSMINRGAQNYQAMCTGCHTAPGEQPSVQSQGLNPHPPDLAELSDELTPGEAFWVIKNGVKMTGMPAFGPTHEDTELWALVAFLQHMHEASASEFEQVMNRATCQAPADDGHNHRHGNQLSAAKEQADDGHNHRHANQLDNLQSGDDHYADDKTTSAQQPSTNDGHDHRHVGQSGHAHADGDHHADDDAATHEQTDDANDRQEHRHDQ